jgi:hypothetical protein
MKIENEVYVLTHEFYDEILYLTEKYGFDNDIRNALKAKNRISAALIRNDLEHRCKFFCDIIPLKITYEW